MLALRFGTGRGEGRVQRLQQFLSRGPQRLIVLDNHENDAASRKNDMNALLRIEALARRLSDAVS